MPTYHEFTMHHYEVAIAMWQNMPGIGISDSDQPAATEQFLLRNKGCNFVALDKEQLIGTILCGHDGRRGYIYHLAVHPDYRRQGIASQLVAMALAGLQENRILKCHLFVFDQNETGIAFWASDGWEMRDDLEIMSKYVS